MSGLIKLREEIHNQTLKHRSIYTLIFQTKFDVLWTLATKEERIAITKDVKSLNRKAITDRIKALKDPGETSFDDLRERAKQLKITGYSRMDKVQLIIAIRREMQNG